MSDILDARGVAIAPGDTALYGFGVGRSVAMAEAVVLGAHMHAYRVFERTDYCLCGDPWPCDKTPSVSLTPSGRVRLRVVRRSYSSGAKPVVDVAPDRLVVLKKPFGIGAPGLPPSPLPTQAEEARADIERRMNGYKEDLRSDRITWGEGHFADLAAFHAYAAEQLATLRRKLREIDDPA